MRLLHVGLTDGCGAVLDVTIPPGAYDPVSKTGWKVNEHGKQRTWIAPKAGASAKPSCAISKSTLECR